MARAARNGRRTRRSSACLRLSATGRKEKLPVPDRTNSSGVRLYLDANRGPLSPEGCADDWQLRVAFAEGGLVYPADEALYRVDEPLPARDPRAPAPASGGGAVPDGVSVAGPPLTLRRAAGDRITLEWGASCREGDADYAVYEGSLGRFDSHRPHHCSTGGATTLTYRPREGDRYLLVVPRDALHEGSYGVAASGAERPASAAPCLPQELRPCP